MNYLEKSKQDVLKRAFELIPSHGLNLEMLELACQHLNQDNLFFYTIFPLGLEDFVKYMISDLDQQMINRFNDKKDALTKISAKISTLLIIRFDIMNLNKNSYVQLHNYLSSPCNALFASKCAYHTSDLMWKLAKDTSIDFNYYSKRAILTMIYVSTNLYWINDDSENFYKTKEFLARRLNEVRKFGEMKKNFLAKFSSFIPQN